MIGPESFAPQCVGKICASGPPSCMLRHARMKLRLLHNLHFVPLEESFSTFSRGAAKDSFSATAAYGFLEIEPTAFGRG
jgi:hypothetical protein